MRDAALMLDVISGPDTGDSTAAWAEERSESSEKGAAGAYRGAPSGGWAGSLTRSFGASGPSGPGGSGPGGGCSLKGSGWGS